LNGQLSVGSLLVFLSYLSSLYAPLETLAFVHTGLSSASVSGRRVLEVLEAKDMVAESPSALPLTLAPGKQNAAVRIHNVTFGYETGPAVLHNVTVEAYPGQTIAIVGATGAGKSTLLGLIPRFFDPWEGRVEIDGRDVRDVQLNSLRRHISLVMQEPFLLPLTVAQNIAYGRPDASPEEIRAAARAASAHDFIERLPNGYDTHIGERGATLSGGERQRISIARAFLKDAPILILDEPTSALDAGTESNLVEILESLAKGRTTFIIAHRLSTIRHADRIFVLANGRVAEVGTHHELIAHNGIYSGFCQIAGVDPRGKQTAVGGLTLHGA
jgi:ABC-type multidrug transport system fused ATPase/permease subunit